MKQDKIDKLILDCYVELFDRSTPRGDFVKLMDNASINEIGEKEIPFMDYELESDVFTNILEKYASQMKPRYKQQLFRTTILLGCSPKHKI